MEFTSLIGDNPFLSSESNFNIHYSRETPFLIQHMHDFIEIACVTEGEGIHYIQGKNFGVSKGDIFVIPRGVPHVFQPLDLSGNHPLRVVNILLNIEEDFFLREKTNYDLESLKWILVPIISNKYSFSRTRDSVCDLLSKIANSSIQHNTNKNNEELYYSLSHALSLLSQHLQPVSDIQELGDFHYPIHKAMQQMVSQFNRNITANEISKHAAMSVRHFQRLFKQLTGISFIKMMQHIRMLYSLWLLKHTNLSIQSIATQVGISDMKHFYKLFHQHFSMTPGDYRNNQYHLLYNSSFLTQLSIWR
jgi:AraC-like DNA-binding protein